MTPDELREDREKRADAARSAGRDEEAIRLYEEILAADLAGGRFVPAVAVYQRVVLWKPADDELHRRLARRIAVARESLPAGSALGALPETALLAGIPPAQLAGALEKMTARRFPAGTTVLREGEPGDSLYLITEGRVEVETRDDAGERVVLGALGPGDFFGEISLLTSRPRTATVTAVSGLETLELTRAALVSLRAAYPDLERALAEAQRTRAERTAEALIEQRRRRT
ncbi:MAG TPA: cyclic nucleotide-binding domain-containing protein [Thermoanaerobaculia bacterium]|nr:cyclic nucleotide-binding domain-containing protein [Thermoanaerobaculia bacterium]